MNEFLTIASRAFLADFEFRNASDLCSMKIVWSSSTIIIFENG